MSPILVALDLDGPVDSVIEAADTLARSMGAPLYLLHVEPAEPEFMGYEPGPQHVRDKVAADVMSTHRTVHSMAADLREKGRDAHALVIQGPAAEKILEEAASINAGMIVLGNHGHGRLHNLFAGSVAESVVQHADRPVLLIPLT